MLSSRIDYRQLKKLNISGDVIKEASLSQMTTFRVGGRAKYLVQVHTLEGLTKVVLYLQNKGIKPFIIGNGSNLLVSDKGYKGVVLQLKGNLAIIERTGETTVECGSGMMISQAYSYCRAIGLKGLECSCGIPATIGGAVYMNASAYEFEMSKIVEYVVAFHNGKIEYLTNEQCQFGYRSSLFSSGDYVIIRVGLRLKSSEISDIDDRCRNTLLRRKVSQPTEYPSAGCVFKRIEGLNVSKMLDDAGCKGLKVGGAEVSSKHANFIINTGNATARDIYQLINVIKSKFYEKYKVKLELEIKLLGEFDEIIR